jgi:hypothetical protein
LARLRDFSVAAGRWGWPSVIGTMFLVAVSLYEHIVGHNLTAYAFVLLAAFVFCLGAFHAWSAENRQRLTLEAILATIEVRLLEIHGKSVDPTKADTNSDIFLRVRIELKNPREATIANYRLDLVSRERSESADWVNDVTGWHAMLTAEAGMPTHDFVALPSELRQGEPHEGWLHFVTPSIHPKSLKKFAPRLIVQTKNGSAFGEHPADPAIWNPIQMMIRTN